MADSEEQNVRKRNPGSGSSADGSVGAVVGRTTEERTEIRSSRAAAAPESKVLNTSLA